MECQAVANVIGSIQLLRSVITTKCKKRMGCCLCLALFFPWPASFLQWPGTLKSVLSIHACLAPSILLLLLLLT